MKPPAMHKQIESEISKWREEYSHAEVICRENPRELESHLRDAIDTHTTAGLTPAEAIQKARKEIGDPTSLNTDYQKNDQRAT